jgi:hypothetical protein
MAKDKKSLTESLKEVLAPTEAPVAVTTDEDVNLDNVEQIDELWKATQNEKGEHILKHKSGKVSSKSYPSKEEAISAAVRKNKLSGAFKEETDLEETAASDSLHPGAAPGDSMSKIEMMAKAIGAMSVMNQGDLTHWFTQAIENSKHYSKATDGKAAGNESSLDMKPSAATTSSAPKTKDPMPKLSVKEDVEEMLSGYDLTEEFKEQATTLFEAAVTARVILENTRLEEAFEAKLEEAITEVSEGLSDQIDNYLTYVVEHFMEENEVAIESSLRNELMDEFIEGLTNLMQNHRFSIPEEKVDVVESLADKVTELEAKFDEQLEENIALKEALVEVERERIVEGFLEGLALSEADKFLKLTEGVTFDGDLETYSKKLSVVKENYFNKKSAPAKTTNIVEESFEGDTVSEVSIDPQIARYMDSINRNLKK